MDIVDEVTLMDYFTACKNGSLSRSASGLGGDCDPTHALMLAAPFLNYAQFLQKNHNRTVLLDLGVAISSAGKGRITSELELEAFLMRSAEILGSSVHNFPVFENSGYEAMAKSVPCPKSNPMCCNASDPVCTAAGFRPPRAIWWYRMFGANQKKTWRPINASAIDAIVRFCEQRHVTELYVDQYPTDASALGDSWKAFLAAADKAHIDIYLYVGEDAGPGIAAGVANIAAWCKTHGRGTCGRQLSRTTHFTGGGGAFKTRLAAAAACASAKQQLCTKAELAGHSGCEVGWAADFEGYWMATASKGCGRAGYNGHGGAAGAWCCQS